MGTFFPPVVSEEECIPYVVSHSLCDLQVLGASSTTAHGRASLILSHGERRHELGSAVLSLHLSREAIKRRSWGGDTHSMLAL